MSRVFRPRFMFWLLEVLLPCVLVGAIIIGPYVTEGKFAWVPTLYLVLLCFLLVLVPALRTRVVATSWSISGYVGFHTFQLKWPTIVVADLRAGSSSKPYLILATAQELVQIPLSTLNAQAIWELVQARVRPEALEKKAYQRVPAYERLAEQNADWVEFAKPRRMREVHPLIGILVGMSVALFTLAAVEVWASSPWLRWVGMGIAMAEFVPIIPIMSMIEVDAVAISRANSLGVLRIPWDEVEQVIITTGDNGLNLCGETHGKKTVRALFGPAWWWPGKERTAVIAMLELICRHRGIDFQVERERK